MTDPALENACGTRIAFTGREGGTSIGPYASLNLGDHVDDDLEAVLANRRAALDALAGQLPLDRLVVPKQVHGTRLVCVGEDLDKTHGQVREGADGILCTKSDVAVLLCFADCVPVVIVAPNGAFAVAHAGWRGAIDGIAESAARALAEEAGVEPGACNAYIGPHIGACCYEVSSELLDSFTAAFGSGCDAGGKLDLDYAVAASLQRGGIDSARIAHAGVCTSCAVSKYYSYRAEGGVCGRHGAFAWRKGGSNELG